MRLEKLITTNPIWDFFTETFDLLSAGQFENLVFRPQSQGGQICVSWAHPLGPAPFLWTLCLSSDRVSRMRAKRSDAKTRKILGNVTRRRMGRMKRRRSPRKVARMKSGRRRNVKKVPIPLRRRRPLRKVTRRRIKRSGSLRTLRRRRPLRKMAPMMSAKKMKLDPTQHVGIPSNLIQWMCEPHAEI